MHLFNTVSTVSFSHTHMHTHSQTPCYSFYKSLFLCRNRRDSQYRIKASLFSWLRLPSFHLKSFVTIMHPIPLPSQHKCVLIKSLTVPHTYFNISSSALSLLILQDSPVLSIKLWRSAASVINCLSTNWMITCITHANGCDKRLKMLWDLCPATLVMNEWLSKPQSTCSLWRISKKDVF